MWQRRQMHKNKDKRERMEQKYYSRNSKVCVSANICIQGRSAEKSFNSMFDLKSHWRMNISFLDQWRNQSFDLN